MAGKARVHELAKELGVESKTVLAKLKDLGEFVKSASSTVEAPVARRLRESFVDPQPAASGGSAPAKSAGKPKSSAAPSARPSARPGPGPKPGPRPQAGPAPSAQSVEAKAAEARVAEIRAAQEAAQAASAAARAETPAPAEPAAAASGTDTPAAPAGPQSGGPRPASPGPRPGPRPAAASPRPGPNSGGGGRPGGGRGGPARPGNNPFGVGAGTPAPRSNPRPGPSQGGGGGGDHASSPAAGGAPNRGPRPGPASGMPPRPGGGDRQGGGGPGGPRPNPGMMPPRPSPGSMPARGPRPGGGGPGGPGGGRGGPGGGGAGRPGGGGGGAGRPGGGGGGGGGGRPGGGGGGYRGAPGAGGGGGAPAGGGFRPGGGGGRPGGGGRGRGGTAGAFGRPGGRPTRGRKSKKQRRQEFDNLSAPTMQSGAPRGDGSAIKLVRGASLADFADKINANPGSLVQEAFNLGEMVTATQSCSDETLMLMGEHLNYEVTIVSPEDEDRELLARFDLEFDGDYEGNEYVARPPVVTVMGHVDHGKTRLLDTIRKANVQAGEAGGITQHIGAYQVHVEHDGNDRAITFIDTPGHEAFTAMRARGAETTDIVVLVVAADDGVKPQTIEALNHAQAAKVPIVVAVNKIDKEGADPAKVRGQLTEYGLVPEEYGGDTMFVDVSARADINIDGLLNAVLLTADAALELTAPIDVPAQGTVIEARLDRGRGPVATVLVQRGILRVGDSVVTGEAHGRVRAMLDEHLVPVKEAGPSSPVRVLGLTAVPGAGDNFLVVPEDRVARQIADQRAARERNAQQAATRARPTLESIFERLKEGEKTQLTLILKGDVSGSVEALEDSLLKIEVAEEVELQIIGRGVGAITENDINLARTADAVIIGFNVRAERNARDLAERENVDIRYYSVIYQAIDDVEAALKGMLKPEYEEVQLGTAEIREVYRSSRFGNIAGTLVRSGLIRRNAKARLIRDGAVVADNLAIESLRRFKDDATEVREGYECGIGLGSFNDIRVDDVIETFEMQEKPRA